MDKSLELAVKEYVENYNNNPSITKISKKYNVKPWSLSKQIKALGYKIINHQNRTKFNKHIFDVIDTEEKAYWLGFIFADGYVSNPKRIKSKPYYFELCLKGSDKGHLDKFNRFMEHEDINHVHINKQECFKTGTIISRCRWGVSNEHLWRTLNSYGCVPTKSLILKFPDLSVFQDKFLIKHFIRGYWDGDGCLSYTDKAHTRAHMSVLGTEQFLMEMMNYLPLTQQYKLSNAACANNITKKWQISGKPAFCLCYYLYNDATVYLDRKFQQYLEYCRVYEESYILLQVKNGKIRIDDPVLNLGPKEPKSV